METSKLNFSTRSWTRWLTPVVLLISMALVASGCGSSSNGPAPPHASTVAIERDDKGVWFITGSENDRLYDVFEVMGYAVATDRLWQAETFRRNARGRLSEIFGPSQLNQDKFIRTTGYSEQELIEGFAALNAEERDVISGYVAGFNRRIAEIRENPALLPFEFSAVGITSATLEDWTYQDVLAWASLLSRMFDPGAHRTGQIENAALYQTLVAEYGPDQGTRMFEDLRWLNDPDALTYIPKPVTGAMAAGRSASETKSRTPLMEMAAPPAFPDLREVAERMVGQRLEIDNNLKAINAYIRMGSYAWAISGDKTATGNPMIYSGPQMGFSVPSIIGEGSIRAGGLNVSGMHVAGLPGIVIGRTPHHAWSMQVGQAHTVDYYLESADAMRLHRTETIKVAGSDDVIVPIYRTARGPVINETPPMSWKYAHWEHEFRFVKAYLDLARATGMDQFGAAIELVPVSQHFTYVDRDGNIAYWMSGRDPVRPDGEWRLPQGTLGAPLEWDSDNLIPRTTDRNTSQGYYCGWNNKARAGYPNTWNNVYYSFGPAHRAHAIEDYLFRNDNLTFDQVKQLALNIATVAVGREGNPWRFISDYFIAAVNADPTPERQSALAILAQWDGHFVDGGFRFWADGTDHADAWVLIDTWIDEVLRLTFEELDVVPSAKDRQVLFDVLIHGLSPGGLDNAYNWFQNADPSAPQTADAIIVEALDNTLAALGAMPWGDGERPETAYNHTLLGEVHCMPWSNRSTYAHVVEYGSTGPVKIKSMFPLGISGNISGPPPAFDDHFFSMADVFDMFVYRDFPLFVP
jgi:penicillin G amidase